MERLLRFRSRLLRQYAPSTANRHLGAAKAMFNYAVDIDLVDRLPPIKKGLAKLSVKQLRQYKAEKRRENGATCFAPAEVRGMITKAGVPLKAMILLGINGGFGNKDCADLRIADVDSDDYVHFESCASGPDVPQNDPTCANAILDDDDDVDQSDFGIFQRCYSGEDYPADPNCAG